MPYYRVVEITRHLKLGGDLPWPNQVKAVKKSLPIPNQFQKPTIVVLWYGNKTWKGTPVTTDKFQQSKVYHLSPCSACQLCTCSTRSSIYTIQRQTSTTNHQMIINSWCILSMTTNLHTLSQCNTFCFGPYWFEWLNFWPVNFTYLIHLVGSY
jgi:hypothetical protein